LTQKRATRLRDLPPPQPAWKTVSAPDPATPPGQGAYTGPALVPATFFTQSVATSCCSARSEGAMADADRQERGSPAVLRKSNAMNGNVRQGPALDQRHGRGSDLAPSSVATRRPVRRVPPSAGRRTRRLGLTIKASALSSERGAPCRELDPHRCRGRQRIDWA